MLSLCRPGAAYVSIGYHRRLDEIDGGVCRAEGLPVIRRQIGGGPVLIDADQLFFRLTLPVRDAPAGVDRLYAQLLEPAAAAFRALGLDARLDGLNDIAVGDRKISGTGAGQIGDAVVVVGNVIFGFDHERMARVLALPDRAMRAECLRLMRRHVCSLADAGGREVTAADATAALREAYGAAFGTPVDDALSAEETAAVERWEARLADEAWTQGPRHGSAAPRGRRVKVRSDVFVVFGEEAGLRVLATVVGDSIERATVGAAHLNGTATALENALVGPCIDAHALAGRLAPFGDDGRHVLTALAPGLEARW